MPTTLITGSSGKTSSRVARLFHENKQPFLVASRKGTAPAPYADRGVKFDWNDSATYANPFTAAADIKAVYLVASDDASAVDSVKAFIAYALDRDVKRFVLLSAAPVPAGGPFMGQVHAHLVALQASRGVEFAVLRPTWFMENFSETYSQLTIRDHDYYASAAGHARLPLVSCDDIAAIAYRALLDAAPHNTDYLILGPESQSYGDFIARISAQLGRTITYRVNTPAAQIEEIAAKSGVPREYAVELVGLDAIIESGAEDRLSDDTLRVLGRPPVNFDEYVRQNLGAWKKA